MLSSEGREQIKYKVRKFLFGSKDTEGVGKLAAVYLLLISIGFVYLYPVLYMISKSFMNLNDLLDTSIVIAGLPTLINVVICAIVGYGFARYEFKGKKLCIGLLLFSFILPPQATMMPTYVFYTDIGLINSIKAFIVPAILGQGLKSQIFILMMVIPGFILRIDRNFKG